MQDRNHRTPLRAVTIRRTEIDILELLDFDEVSVEDGYRLTLIGDLVEIRDEELPTGLQRTYLVPLASFTLLETLRNNL